VFQHTAQPPNTHAQVLLDNNVHFGVKRQTLDGALRKLFGGLFSLWLPLLPFFFILKRVIDAQSGKSKKTKQTFDPPSTTFKDVAGVDVVKAELQEAIACLRDPSKYEKLNAQMPSGVLLSGPPGTGASAPAFYLACCSRRSDVKKCEYGDVVPERQ
jgi:ATP-dependent Zn protease